MPKIYGGKLDLRLAQITATFIEFRAIVFNEIAIGISTKRSILKRSDTCDRLFPGDRDFTRFGGNADSSRSTNPMPRG